MTTPRFLITCLFICPLLIPPPGLAGSGTPKPPTRHPPSPPGLAFIENRGQWDPRVRFVTQRGGVTCWMERDGLLLRLSEPLRDRKARATLLRFAFEGASASARLEGRTPREGRYSFLVGNKPDLWKHDLQAFSQVLYRGLYEGIDLQFREGHQLLEYDLLLQPGADLSLVRIACDGAESLSIDDQGRLCMETALGTVRQSAPATWQVLPDGRRQEVPCRFKILPGCRYGFEVPDRVPEYALVIDPGILWSTFAGGSDFDAATKIVERPNGDVALFGTTGSLDYPAAMVQGAFSMSRMGITDLHVTVLSGDGSALRYATYLGGALGLETDGAMILDGSGNLVLTGQTFARDFPTTPMAFDTQHGGNGDAYVAVLNPDATLPPFPPMPGQPAQLLYSTFLGETGADAGNGDGGNGLAMMGNNILVVGETFSSSFPITPTAVDSSRSSLDAFVTILTPDLTLPPAQQLVYSTFLGGPGLDRAMAVAFDPATGLITVGGIVFGSGSFPTTPMAYRASRPGGQDVWIARIDPDLQNQNPAGRFVYGTLFGGGADENLKGLAVEANGDVTIAGDTNSSNFPAFPIAPPSAYAITFGGVRDGFVSRLRLAGTGPSDLRYSTFLGGTGADALNALTLDASGTVTVAGSTSSADFPTTPWAFDTSFNGDVDGFVVRLRLDPNHLGGQLLYASFLGGSGGDIASGLTLSRTPDATSVLVSGRTTSTEADFPIVAQPPAATPYDPTQNGSTDAFATRTDMLPANVSKYGRPSGTNARISLGAFGLPRAGQTLYVTLDGVTPNAAVAIALARRADPNGTFRPNYGVTLYVDPASIPVPSGRIRATADATGHAVAPVRIPGGTPAGATFFIQAFEAPASRPLGGATAALAVTTQ